MSKTYWQRERERVDDAMKTKHCDAFYIRDSLELVVEKKGSTHMCCFQIE